MRVETSALASRRATPRANAGARPRASETAPAASGPMIAPASLHIEKTATALPPSTPPVASPTLAAGAVLMAAAPTA